MRTWSPSYLRHNEDLVSRLPTSQWGLGLQATYVTMRTWSPGYLRHNEDLVSKLPTSQWGLGLQATYVTMRTWSPGYLRHNEDLVSKLPTSQWGLGLQATYVTMRTWSPSYLRHNEDFPAKPHWFALITCLVLPRFISCFVNKNHIPVKTGSCAKIELKLDILRNGFTSNSGYIF